MLLSMYFHCGQRIVDIPAPRQVTVLYKEIVDSFLIMHSGIYTGYRLKIPSDLLNIKFIKHLQS